MASFMWTMLCPLHLYGWTNTVHYPACPTLCGALIGKPGGLYNFSLLNVFSPLTFHILDIYRTGNLWHLALPRQEMYPASAAFVKFLSLRASFLTEYLPAPSLRNIHTHRDSHFSDNCHSSPALRSWTGLTTSVCINTLLLPLSWLLFIVVMFTRT